MNNNRWGEPSRHRQIVFPLVYVLWLFCPPLAHATSIDMEDFLQAVIQHNPGVQRILAQEAIAAGQLASSRGIDDLSLGINSALSRSEPDVITGAEPNRSYGALFDVSMERLLSDRGTRLSASYGNRFTSRRPGTTTLGASFHQPSFTLGLTQPLLKNAKGIQDRLNINLGQQRHDLAKLLAKEELESYVTRLAALYLDWYLSYREMIISKEVYHQTLEQEKLVQLKVNRQVAEPYELLRVQETHEDFFSRWQQAVGRYEGLKHQVQVQMHGIPGSASTTSGLLPLNPQGTPLLISLASTPNYLVTDSRLKAVLDTLEALELTRLNALEDAQKPVLDLGLTYTRHGSDSNLVDANTGALDRDDMGVMLNYRYPLGNRVAKGALSAQRAASRQVTADTAQRLLDAEAALGNLLSQQKQLTVALKSSDRKIDLAAQKLKAEQRLYNIGQLDLFELLQDQTAQLETRLNRERLSVQLQKIRLGIGELFDRNLASLIPTPEVLAP